MMVISQRYDSLFQWYAQVYGLSWKLLKAQALAESALNPNAVSPVGAVGLTQFMRKTWLWVTGKKRGRRNPERAIHAQAKYMAYLFRRIGADEQQVLAAYNWGEGNVLKAGSDWHTKMPTETRNYVSRISNLAQKV